MKGFVGGLSQNVETFDVVRSFPDEGVTDIGLRSVGYLIKKEEPLSSLKDSPCSMH